MENSRFSYPTYLVRRKIIKFFGGAFHIFGPNGELLFYSKMKAFKLKEDIRLYTDESMKEEVLLIKARNIIDIYSTYDVFDSKTGEKIGALRRKGLKSLFKDEWVFLDGKDAPIGSIKEDSMLLALMRRFLSGFIPQTYDGFIGENRVCKFRQNFNPFVLKITLDFSQDINGQLDRRLGIAGAVLLCAIEGRQD
jgi:uncharacterized protein YxjI